jgi:hypothetical protein
MQEDLFQPTSEIRSLISLTEPQGARYERPVEISTNKASQEK